MCNEILKDFRKSCFSIIVSYQSERLISLFLPRHRFDLGDRVFIVNSHPNPLYEIALDDDVTVIEAKRNVGFAAANNIALEQYYLRSAKFVFFINPDVLLPEGWLERLHKVVMDPKNADIGVFTGPLLGYSFETDRPTGLIDSLGIFQTIIGKWYDKSQGMLVDNSKISMTAEYIPAACGALMVVRREVVEQIIQKDNQFFDESFFMYKEDIDVSIRIRKMGWKILIHPSLKAYHCRGWNSDRSTAPYWSRLISARNEIMLHLRHRWFALPYSIIKYCYVRLIEK
ncbi:MAG: glycosyltransferase family 2 protein [Oxalobacteraceae bacterium]|nr:glycosyltransferase family 2 protein [Oxalobacteraceae bacterium]